MSKKRATADSWKTRPMPEARKELELDGTFTREEYLTISQGFIPQQQEDKWFIYLEDEWLHVHRSWTGTCVFQLQIVPFEDGYQAVKAVVNRDPSQYKGTDEEYDVALISYLIDHLLLGRFVPFPMPRHLSDEDKAVHKRHVMGTKGEDSAASVNLRVLNGRNRPDPQNGENDTGNTGPADDSEE